MNNIKVFAKNEKELEILIQVIRIYSQDIGIEFDTEKCAMFIMKWEKTSKGRNRTTTSGKNQNAWREGKLQILEKIESRDHQTSRDKRKK